MKKIIFLTILIMFPFAIYKSLVYAVDTTSTVIFPIAELGNCASKEACYAYCNFPQNRDACLAFAKSHNFTRPIVNEAKTFLGCSDEASCKVFCSQPQNHAKCEELSRRMRDLKKPPIATPSASLTQALFAATQLELGCNSEDSCKTVCSQNSNVLRCQNFLRRHQLWHEEKVENRPKNSLY